MEIMSEKEYKDTEITKEINEVIEDVLDYKGGISDGSHTFDELYFHRMILFATVIGLCPETAWKSKLHSNGTMFENYFIVGIDTPEGQYSYHYHTHYWDYFEKAETVDKAPTWDGHEPSDVARLLSLIDLDLWC